MPNIPNNPSESDDFEAALKGSPAHQPAEPGAIQPGTTDGTIPNGGGK